MEGTLTFTFENEADRDRQLILMGVAALHLRGLQPEVSRAITDLGHRMVQGMQLKQCPFCKQSTAEKGY